MHKRKSVKEQFDLAIAKILILLENLISIISVIVLTVILLFEIRGILTDPSAYLNSTDSVANYLREMLNIVVGLEFVKLLMHLTPANILEVLVLAISRSIIISHGSAVDNLLGIVCIALLFATKRYLIPKQDMHHSMAEETAEPEPTPQQAEGPAPAAGAAFGLRRSLGPDIRA